MGQEDSKLSATATKESDESDKQFKDSLEVVITFWQDMGKTPDKRKTMVDTALENLLTTHPEYESLFKRKDQFSGMLQKMFDVLVDLLSTSKHDEAFEVIEKLGKMHRRIGVPANAFNHWMSSFERAIQEYFPQLFTARTQFCFLGTMNFVISSMIQAAELDLDEEPSASVYQPKYAENYFDTLDVNDWESFSSNEICLHYLHLHLVNSLSSEMSLFLREVLEYRRKPTSENYEDIYRTYIDTKGHMGVNVSEDTRISVSKAFDKHGATEDVFDAAVEDVGNLIRDNRHIWVGFRESKLWDEMLKSIEKNKAHSKRVHMRNNSGSCIGSKSESHSATPDLNKWETFASNETCLHYLHLHLVKAHSPEMSLFLQEVLEFRRATREKYDSIYRTYIAMDGATAVNVSEETRDIVSKAFGATEGVFDAAVEEVGTLIRENRHIWKGFRESKLWSEMLESIEKDKENPKRAGHMRSVSCTK